jgi:hypothetical protein
LFGGAGDDAYIVNASSFVSEVGGGADTVYADNDVNLTDAARFATVSAGVTGIEWVVYRQAGGTPRDWSATGDSAANTIVGGNGRRHAGRRGGRDQ